MSWYHVLGIVLLIVGASAAGIFYGSRSIGKGFEESEKERDIFKHL